MSPPARPTGTPARSRRRRGARTTLVPRWTPPPEPAPRRLPALPVIRVELPSDDDDEES
jgi:hypothetical protein